VSIDKENESPTLKDGDCLYTLDGNNGEATLTGVGHDVLGAYEIPRSLGGCPVTGIAERVFALHSGLTSVTIPESATRIEEGTFNGCHELTQIHVDEGNPRYRSIDGMLFDKEGLRLLRCPPGRSGAYSVPVGVSEVADYAFSCCYALTDVTLPASVRSIGDRAFTCCTGVKAFTVDAESPFLSSPDGVLFSKDGEELIQFPLGKAERYTVPAGVRRIAQDAFCGKSVLTSVDVDEANEVFSGFGGYLCDKGRTRIVQVPTGIRGKIRIPGSVVTVCGFSFCTDLTEAVIESGVTGIAAGAFMDCVRLASVTLPDSVANIESYAFAGCRRLAGITMPDRVTRIEASMFSGCRHLITVVGGRNITEIGDSAFRNCGSLAAFTFPQGVSKIEKSAFYGCSSLKNLAIPKGVVEIAPDTFSHCSGVEAVTLPDEVIKIGSSAFADCISLTEVSIPESVTCIEEYAFSGCVKLPHVTLPKSVRRIGDGVFSSCSLLSGIEIPAGVTRLFSYTFCDCNGLRRIGVPASLIRIGDLAFIGNRSLAAIDVAEGNPLYRSVGGVLFDKKLTRLVRCPEGYSGSLFIPASVERLSPWCFESCERLTEINVEEANPWYSSLEGILYNKRQTTLLTCPGGKTGQVMIPARVDLLASGAFDGCEGVTGIVADGANRHYRSVDGILYDRQMTTVVRCPEGKKGLEIIPASVTHRADGSHRKCRGLSAVEADDANPCFSSLDGILYDKGYIKLIGCPDARGGVVDIPASVACVSKPAFSNCSGVTEIRVNAANPFFSSEDGILFNKDRSRLICCPWGKEGVARIPANFMDFEDNAFWECAKLTAFDVASDNPVYSSRDGLLLNKKMTNLILCPRGKSGQVRIPASVEIIHEEAFKGCDQLECVVIPDEAMGVWCDMPSHWFSGEIRYEE